MVKGFKQATSFFSKRIYFPGRAYRIWAPLLAGLTLALIIAGVAAAGGAILWVSTDSAGVQGNSSSNNPDVSAGGGYVVFESYASNLVTGDTNGTWDVFIKDTRTGAIERVSTDSGGSEGNSYSQVPSISADGRYVAFYSRADNLVPGDTNGSEDIFVKDTQTGATTRVSTDSSGTQGNVHSRNPAISADGRYVAFYSNAYNLVAGDTNVCWDVFVKDTQTGAIERVSTDSAGVQGNGESRSESGEGPAISAGGRYVAFESLASNLVPGDTNGT